MMKNAEKPLHVVAAQNRYSYILSRDHRELSARSVFHHRLQPVQVLLER